MFASSTNLNSQLLPLHFLFRAEIPKNGWNSNLNAAVQLSLVTPVMQPVFLTRQLLFPQGGGKKKNPYPKFPVRIHCLPYDPGDERCRRDDGKAQKSSNVHWNLSHFLSEFTLEFTPFSLWFFYWVNSAQLDFSESESTGLERRKDLGRTDLVQTFWSWPPLPASLPHLLGSS